MKKFISLFTTLSIVFSLLGSFTVFAKETYITEISTLAQLEKFRDDVNNGNTYEGKTVVLTKDIDLSSRYGKNKNKWIPIGIGNGKISPDAENIFKGTFDGGGHNLSNVYVHYESEYSSQTIAGFFGLNAGTIKNLVIEGEHTNLNGLCTGGIAGGNFGHIEQCVFSGYVIGPNNSGGIAGGNCGTIENCYNTATIQTYNCGGGIAGTNDGGTMTHCYNLGSVYIGRTFPDIPKEYQWLGSLCAGSADSVIGCYYLINTCKKGVYTFSEEGDGGTALTLEQFADKANFEGWDFDNIWEIDSNQLQQKPVFRLRHTPRTITEIYTAEDLKEFRYSVNCGNNYDGKTVKLMADIELDINEPWTPIGGIGHIEYQADAGGFLPTREFSGIFDGQNHTISGINLSERVGSVVGLDYDYQGFFGSVDEAEIKNFTLKGKLNAVLNTSGSSGRTYIGSAAAHLESSDISNVISYVDIETEVISSKSIDCLGGIAGDVDYYSAITNCTNYGNITVTGDGSKPSFDSIGGIAGETSYSNANNCMNYGNITTNCVGSRGGVIGETGEYSSLKYSANRGKLSVSAIAGYVGGITGRIKDNSSKLTSCYNIGKITCPDVAACGGIAGATNLDASINLLDSQKFMPPYQ